MRARDEDEGPAADHLVDQGVWREAFLGTAAPAALVRLEPDGRATVLEPNRALAALLDLAPAELLGRDAADLAPSVVTTLNAAAGGANGAPLGIAHVQAASAPPPAGTVLATRDALTGMAGRAAFLERLRVALARTRRGHGATAVLFLDLDEFKEVNDVFGHDCGDRVLVEVAGRLRGALREGDLAARFGGDEFAIVCDDLAPDDADRIARRVEHALEAPARVATALVSVRASIGVAVAAPGEDRRPEALLDDADLAMYQAKRHGKARVRHFDEAMRDRVARRFALESDLRRGLDDGEFVLAFQDKVSLADLRVVGVEALVRWEHPQRGRRPPAAFIPTAEASGLIVELGRLVLEQACAALAARRAGGDDDLEVCVNVSPRQLADPAFPRLAFTALERAGLPATALCVEITESVLLDDATHPLAAIRALRAAGATVALDDFGTGYSALGYLRRFPVDLVKIDRTFVAELGTSATATAIVEAVMTMSRAIGLRVVAEGVETRAQCDTLVELGCDYAQGYLFGRPELAGMP